MKRLNYILILFVCYACSDLDEIPEPDLFKIYLGERNSFVFDIQETSNGLLIFSVGSDNRMNNKFEGDGSISLVEVDNNGKGKETAFIKRFNAGFPSNVLNTGNNQFLFFFNENTDTIRAISINFDTDPPTIDVKTVDCSSCKANKVLKMDNGNYLFLGILEQPTSLLSIVEVDDHYEFVRTLQTISFNRTRLGGNNPNYISLLDNYLNLSFNQDRLLFTGPMGNNMVVSHVGEVDVEFSSNSLWIGGLEQRLDSDAFTMVFLNPSNTNLDNEIFIHQDIEFNGLPKSTSLNDLKTEESISGLDPNARIFIKEFERDRIHILSTTRNGHPRLFQYTTEIKSKEFGDNNRLDVGGFIKQGEFMVIAGSTTIQGQLQRPFIIKVPEGFFD